MLLGQKSLLIDETGNKYGKLTVLYRAPRNKKHKVRWVCRCECGRETEVGAHDLRRHTRSCKACSNIGISRNIKDLVGKSYGRLTVVKRMGSTSRSLSVWMCKCECGTYVVKDTIQLGSNGPRQSCGCVVREARDMSLKRYHEGAIFGRFTLIKMAFIDPHGSPVWRCRCVVCGTELYKRVQDLYNGAGDRACGCLKSKDSVSTGLKRVYDGYKRHADALGLQFELTMEDVRRISTQNCFYCGCVPNRVEGAHRKHANNGKGYLSAYNGKFIYNGIDRMDSTIGYIENNVVSCCFDCNVAKRVRPVDTFAEWIRTVYLVWARDWISKR